MELMICQSPHTHTQLSYPGSKLGLVLGGANDRVVRRRQERLLDAGQAGHGSMNKVKAKNTVAVAVEVQVECVRDDQLQPEGI